MSFGHEMTAFFDELGKIRAAQEKKREDVYGSDHKSRPFSSLLTQDEEPTDYFPDQAVDEEPQVIVRV
jgi:hypothetical protein